MTGPSHSVGSALACGGGAGRRRGVGVGGFVSAGFSAHSWIFVCVSHTEVNLFCEAAGVS